MNPKHTNPTRSNRIAHAPYNFVPLPEKVVTVDVNQIPDHDVYEGYTGYIDCNLTTLSPVYTRTAMNPDFFAKWADNFRGMMQDDEARKEYAQFFNLGDAERPVIPGSTLRGMVRSLVEIVGYGKMQWVTNEQLVFRAVGDPASVGDFYRNLFLGENKAKSPNMHFDYPVRQVKGGYLRVTSNGGYAIQPAKEFQGESFVHVEYKDAMPIINGLNRHLVHDIFVKPDSRKTFDRGRRGRGVLKLDLAITSCVSADIDNGLQKAKLIESGHMGGKHPKHWHCAIYEQDLSAELIPIPDNLWQLYVQDRDLTRGLPTRKIQKDGDPLFYLMDNQGCLVFFGPTVMFRVPYKYSPFNLVPSSIRIEDDVDIAEAIFGYVPDGDRITNRAGRVCFTDAICESNQDNVWLPEGIITPEILGSPKPTTFQHYLVQDKQHQHNPDDKHTLAHYGTPTPDETVIRGHKLYWHQYDQDFIESDVINWQTDTQHTQIRPVGENVTFKFRVYFENLRGFELGALLWVLNLPDDHHHKIGMGKPLGLGSVAIVPNLYLCDRNSRYQKLFANGSWYTEESGGRDTEQFVREFEDYVLENMDELERGKAQSLDELERIQMLLNILELSKKDINTDYMKNLGEFRNRPVLPTPFYGNGKLVHSQGHSLYRGRVKWFNESKGFGFIIRENKEEIFVHYSAIEGKGSRTLNKNDEVEFSIEQTSRGPQAVGVRILRMKS